VALLLQCPPRRWYSLGSDLPQTVLSLSSGESSLTQEGAVTLSAPVMRVWKETARRALVASSVQESALSALTRQLGAVQSEGPDEGVFTFHEDIRPDQVQALLTLSLRALSAATEATACAYLNCVLARRDAALASVELPPQTKVELRSAPLPADSLFGQPLLDAIHANAKLSRDVAVSKVTSHQFAGPAVTPRPKRQDGRRGPKFARKRGNRRNGSQSQSQTQPSQQAQSHQSKSGFSRRGSGGRGAGKGGASSGRNNPQ
jgi:hypothetical protein